MALELDHALIRLPRVQGAQVYLAQEILDILHDAEKAADQLGDDYISGEHILMGLLHKGKQAAGSLRAGAHSLTSSCLPSKRVAGKSTGYGSNPEAKYQALEKYARNLTRLARMDRLDPVIGRDEEIRRTMQILSADVRTIPF